MGDFDEKLQNIFFLRTGIKFLKGDKKRNLSLLGNQLKIPARELVLIFFDIEKEFEIEIMEYDILKGNLKTYDRTAQMVSRLLNT